MKTGLRLERFLQNPVVKMIGAIVAIYAMLFLILGSLSEFNPNVFCYDDNINQWLPVIDKTFYSFFHEGKLRYWNYSIMGGINILDTGVYSIVNPFMLLSYMIKEFLHISNTITVYIFIIVGAGGCVFYWIAYKIGIPKLQRYSLVFCLYCCSAFWVKGNWYYVVNNIFIGALMAACFFVFDSGKRRWYYPGIVLGFSIYLGNVQYSVMWYMVMAIIYLTLFVRKRDYAELVMMVTNAIVGMLLSFPQLMLCFRASQNTVFENGNPDFFTNPLHIFTMIYHGILPDDVIESVTGVTLVEYYFSSHFYFCGGLLLGAFFLVARLWITRKNDGAANDVGAAFFMAAIFFGLWGLGKKGIVAEILYRFPIINGFRLLEKVWFVILPLLFAVLLFVVKEDTVTTRILIALSVLLGAINISTISIGGGSVSNRNELVDNDAIDQNDYKIISFFGNEGDVCGLNSTHKYAMRSGAFNECAYYGIFSGGGYNLSYTPEQYRTVDKLMNNVGMHSEYATFNAVDAEKFTLGEEQACQIIDNGMKYIVTNSQRIIDIFFASNFIKCEQLIDLGEGLFCIVIEDIPSIVHDEYGNTLPFKISGNSLVVDNFKRNICYIQFPYNDKYKAYIYSKDGKKQQCDITKSEQGFMIVKGEAFDNSSRIVIKYIDECSIITILAAIGTTILSLFCMTKVAREEMRTLNSCIVHC